MQARSSQRGAMMLLVVMALIGAAFLALLTQGGAIIAARGLLVSGTQDTLSNISQALVRFAAVNNRLPCPANPALPVGNALAGLPDANVTYPAVATCTFRQGVVPWAALGLKPQEAQDEWGTVISYRVFDGATGLTQANGASAVNCDTDNTATNGVVTPETPPTAIGACNTDRNTLVASYLNGKGLSVDDLGQVKTGVGFLLISHGKTGLGGYLPSGAQTTMPGVNAGDYANTQAPPLTVFKKLETSEATVTPGSAGHFDDIVEALRIDDILKLAQLQARNWEETPVPDFGSATTANMTSGGTDHFITENQAVAARNFQQVTGSGGAIVSFGGAAGTYSACLWWPNLIEIYRPSTATLAAGTSWSSTSGGQTTYVTTLPHHFSAGQVVVITGAALSGYNGTFTISSIVSSNSFRVSQPADPGSWGATTGGTISPMVATGTSWAAVNGGEITFVTSAAHNLAIQSVITVTGVLPIGYNGTYRVSRVPSTTSFVVAKNINPGTWTYGGTLAPGFRKTLMVAVDVAFNTTEAGDGLVMGFLPHYGYAAGSATTSLLTVNNFTCGTAAGGGIGWDTGTLSSPRFGVEIDLEYNLPLADPDDENHIAVDFSGVVHAPTAGSTAVACSSTASTYMATSGRNGCYNGASTSWLNDGLSAFHKARVEIEPMSASCGGTAPLVKYWLLPSSVCSVGAPPSDCTTIKDTTVPFAPVSFPAGGVVLSQCVPTPTPTAAYDQVNFGFTSSNNTATNAFDNFYLRNLKSGLSILP